MFLKTTGDDAKVKCLVLQLSELWTGFAPCPTKVLHLPSGNANLLDVMLVLQAGF